MISPVNNLVASPFQGYVDLSWEMPQQTFSSYNLYRKEQSGAFNLLTYISRLHNTYRYTLPLTIAGDRIILGISIYSSVSGEESEIKWVECNSFPNPPTNLSIVKSFDNVVELSWDMPSGMQYIQGYIIERSNDGTNFSKIYTASTNHFIDIGSNFKEPTCGKQYKYRISTISYLGKISSSITSASFIVQRRSPVDIKTLSQNNITVPFTGKYRIKAKGTDSINETPWIVRRGLIHSLGSNKPYDFTFRLKVKTVDIGTTIPLKIKSVLVPRRIPTGAGISSLQQTIPYKAQVKPLFDIPTDINLSGYVYSDPSNMEEFALTFINFAPYLYSQPSSPLATFNINSQSVVLAPHVYSLPSSPTNSFTLQTAVVFPRFRLRIIDVDGVESQAIITTTKEMIVKMPYIINRTQKYVTRDDGKKMINRSMW